MGKKMKNVWNPHQRCFFCFFRMTRAPNLIVPEANLIVIGCAWWKWEIQTVKGLTSRELTYGHELKTNMTLLWTKLSNELRDELRVISKQTIVNKGHDIRKDTITKTFLGSTWEMDCFLDFCHWVPGDDLLKLYMKWWLSYDYLLISRYLAQRWTNKT